MAQAYTKNVWTQGALPAVDATVLIGWENGIYLASAPLVTSLPGSPVDGQEVNYLADATNGVVWHLVYRAASGKWLMSGGPQLHSEIANGGNGYLAALNNAYGDLGSPSSPGPSIVVPLAGDYYLSYGFFCYFSNISNANPVGYASPQIGATAATDQDSVQAAPGFTVPAGQQHMHNEARTIKKVGLAAGSTIMLKFKYQNAPPVLTDNRWLDLIPIKVG